MWVSDAENADSAKAKKPGTTLLKNRPSSSAVSLVDEPISPFENKPGQWSPSMNLFYVSGRPLQLLTQNGDIQAIIRASINLIHADIVVVDTFPADGKWVEFAHDSAVRAAVDLRKTEIKCCMDYDSAYLREIAKAVSDRDCSCIVLISCAQASSHISQFRQDLKASAVPIVVEHFQLGRNNGAYVRDLLEKRKFMFPINERVHTMAKHLKMTNSFV